MSRKRIGILFLATLLISEFVSLSAYGEAMSLQQALNKSVKDRVETAERFQENYMSLVEDKELAAQFIAWKPEKEKKRVISSDAQPFEKKIDKESKKSEELDLEDDSPPLDLEN